MTEMYKPELISDFEEQAFANFRTDNTPIQGEFEFGPIPPHVNTHPAWKPLRTTPSFQKHPDRTRI